MAEGVAGLECGLCWTRQYSNTGKTNVMVSISLCAINASAQINSFPGEENNWGCNRIFQNAVGARWLMGVHEPVTARSNSVSSRRSGPSELLGPRELVIFGMATGDSHLQTLSNIRIAGERPMVYSQKATTYWGLMETLRNLTTRVEYPLDICFSHKVLSRGHSGRAWVALLDIKLYWPPFLGRTPLLP